MQHSTEKRVRDGADDDGMSDLTAKSSDASNSKPIPKGRPGETDYMYRVRINRHARPGHAIFGHGDSFMTRASY